MVRTVKSGARDEGAAPTATATVAEALAQMVLGELAPGMSLPSEGDLATRFEVSRLTVREAVKMLAGRGLLDVGRGRRAVVRESSGAAFSDFLSQLIKNDPKGLFDLIELRHPHVLVLDLNMPGPSSLTGIAEVKDTCAVVVLTMQSDPAFAREALQAGARGYVLKEAAGAELVTAVRAAAGGGIYLNPALGARIAIEGAVTAPALDDLSERELDVLRLIALGHTNAEIGEQLFLSMRTVETHRSHIQHKLRRTTRAELVRYALDHGLMDA